jgi:3-isopropylmalate/(R)-2-methylmalate dehydratase small subunit
VRLYHQSQFQRPHGQRRHDPFDEPGNRRSLCHCRPYHQFTPIQKEEKLMKNFSGKTLFLDRADINTDEIIAAKYLTEISKKALGPHLFEDLKLDGFDKDRDLSGKKVIVSRANFGCGSSREHAPWALEANGIHLVIAESFARIFRQNMFNCGMLAVDLPASTIDHLFQSHANKDTTITSHLEKQVLIIETDQVKEEIGLSLSGFDRALVEAGGWVEYADTHY